ncbi:MAG: HAD family hydrolase [Thaumarchaeota archaeon]|nr:HAD family hydrolase [Nitrososphaerota archaeon]
MKAEKFGAYVFDLDGTLFRIPVDWEAVRGSLRKIFATDSQFIPLFESLREHLGNDPARRAEAFAAVDSLELKAVEACEPLPGALDLVSGLRSRAKLGLVTMQGRKAYDRIAMEHGLASAFAVSVTREDSLDRAEQLLSALGRLGVDRGEALFIGDRLNDVFSAQKAGVKVALVGRTGTGDSRPDFSFANLSDLAAFLAA